ncbi:hypothetical protein D4R89_05690, partial [bacterium]
MSKKSFIRGICFFLILNLAWLSGLFFAQRVTGKIIGQVTDEAGTTLPGVTVEISRPSPMGGADSPGSTEGGDYG